MWILNIEIGLGWSEMSYLLKIHPDLKSYHEKEYINMKLITFILIACLSTIFVGKWNILHMDDDN